MAPDHTPDHTPDHASAEDAQEIARTLRIPREALAEYWRHTWRAPGPMRSDIKATYYLTPMDIGLLEEMALWFWRESRSMRLAKSPLLSEAIQTLYRNVWEAAAQAEGYPPELARRIALAALDQRYQEARDASPAPPKIPPQRPVRWYDDVSRVERYAERLKDE